LHRCGGSPQIALGINKRRLAWDNARWLGSNRLAGTRLSCGCVARVVRSRLRRLRSLSVAPDI